MSRKLAKIFGIVFVLVGLLGFIPNPIFGHDALFHTDLVHNLVHLVIGIVLLALGKTEDSARLWLKIFGAVYLVVAILGFLVIGADGMGSILGIIGVNTADNWLHVVLGIVLLVAGFSGGKSTMMPPAPSQPPSGPSM